MESERDKPESGAIPEILERYGRRSGNARRPSPTQQLSGFWQRLADRMSRTEAEAALSDGEAEPVPPEETTVALRKPTGNTRLRGREAETGSQPTTEVPTLAIEQRMRSRAATSVALELHLPDGAHVVLRGTVVSSDPGRIAVRLAPEPANAPAVLQTIGTLASTPASHIKPSKEPTASAPAVATLAPLETSDGVSAAVVHHDSDGSEQLHRRRSQVRRGGAAAARQTRTHRSANEHDEALREEPSSRPAAPLAPITRPPSTSAPAMTDDEWAAEFAMTRPGRKAENRPALEDEAGHVEDEAENVATGETGETGEDGGSAAARASAKPARPPFGGKISTSGVAQRKGSAEHAALARQQDLDASHAWTLPPTAWTLETSSRSRHVTGPARPARDLQRLSYAAESTPQARAEAALGSAVIPSRTNAPPPADTDASDPIVAVDLGATYVRMAAARDPLELIANRDGQQIIPALVAFPEADQVLVGWDAREHASRHPENAVSHLRSLIGLPYGHPVSNELLATTDIPSFAGPEGQICFNAHGRTRSIDELCTLLFSGLYDDATHRYGTHIRRMVLTVPLAYTGPQRHALVTSAQRAGFTEVTLLVESLATMLGHEIDDVRGLVAIYTLGGSTFEFSVVERSPEGTERIVCAAGDFQLGGEIIDEALTVRVAERFRRETGVDLRSRPMAWQTVRAACEEAKCQLAYREAAQVRAEELIRPRSLDEAQQPLGLFYRVSRRELDQLSRPMVEHSLTLVRRALSEGGLELDDIGTVLMSGGGALNPVVRQAVETFFGTPPKATDAHLATIRGAARYATRLSRTDADRDDAGMHDSETTQR